MTHRRWWRIVVALVLVSTAVIPAPAVARNASDVGLGGADGIGPIGPVTAAEARDPSGIALVGRDAIQFRAENEAQALAFDAALQVALVHRESMGYPWIDLGTKVLELSVLADDQENLAALAVTELAKTDLAAAGLSTRVKPARASIADLDEVANAVTHLLDAGVPNADLIWRTEPDQRNNRVIITISEINAELMSALASRFGTDVIAVRVQKGGPVVAAGRDSDSPSFWGGAYITTSTGKACTTGFAWNVGGGKSGMLTAAHCISTGGTVSYPNYTNVGSVTSGSRENWSDSNGTQYYTGQSVYRGDVALITYYSYGSAPQIYSGAPLGLECAVYFTDIRDSYYGLPGSLKVG